MALKSLWLLIISVGHIEIPFFQKLQKTVIFSGPFLLTHLVLPLLAASQNGKIINITALAHFNATLTLDDLNNSATYNAKEIFGRSKLALVYFTKHLARICRSMIRATDEHDTFY